MQEGKEIEEYVEEEDFNPKESVGWKYKLGKFLESKYFVAVVIMLVAVISFSLGRISQIQEKREPVRVINLNNPLNPPYNNGETGKETDQTASVANSTNTTNAEIVVGSKNGAKYHYPWCAGAKQIADKNKIIFNSIEEARAKGYTPASNCKGLK